MGKRQTCGMGVYFMDDMQKLLAALSEVRDDVDFENCGDLVKEGYLTSFDIIQIVTMVRDEYDVKIPVADVIPANFRSAESIWAIVETLLDE